MLSHILYKLSFEDSVMDRAIVVGLDDFRDQFEYHLNAYMTTGEVKLRTFPSPAGTAGELLRIAGDLDDEFLVYYSDIWTRMKLGKFVSAWKDKRDRRKSTVGSMAVSMRLKVDKGVIEMDGGDVLRITEKPELPVPNLCGISIFKRRILKYASPGEDLNANAVPRAIAEGETVLAYPFDEGYIDVGSLHSFKEAQKAVGL